MIIFLPALLFQRDIAWDVFPWPCIGGFWFISLGLTRHPKYSWLVNLLRTPPPKSGPTPTFLDLGTCLGQDLRKLVQDGVPISTLYGCDLFPGFEKVGHALFRDADSFGPEHFIHGDIFSTDPKDTLFGTEGKWSVINMIMFLHIFPLADQEKICMRVLRVYLRAQKGSVVMGMQTGTVKPGEMMLKPPMSLPGEHKTIYRHSQETMKEMWETVAKKANINIKVWAKYDEEEAEERDREAKANPEWEENNKFFVGKDERRIFFFVERQE